MTVVGFKDFDLLAVPPLRNDDFWPNIFCSVLCTDSEDDIFDAIDAADTGTDEDELLLQLYSSYILLFFFS